MTAEVRQASRTYAVMQSVLLCIFVGAVFLAPGTPLLFAGRIWKAVGNAFCLAGLVLLFEGIRRLGRAIQVDPAPRPEATLVTTGVYRWFRHPIYTAIVIVVLGLFLRQASLAVGIATCLVITFLIVKVRFEEKLLMARYPGYSEYKKRSWGLIPWPHFTK